MLTTTLRSNTDNRAVTVNLAGLAMQLRGDIRLVNGNGEKPSESGPAVIVQCAELRDAQQCVEFATRHELLIHLFNSDDFPSVNGHCNQGIAVDLRRLKAPAKGNSNGK